MPAYLTVQDVIAVHEDIMKRLGFSPASLRDMGALESATMRPRMAEQYEDADLIRQAALLAVGISQAQAFLDGNKRTAFAVLDLFLRINAFKYSGEPLDLARQLELVAERVDSLAAATARFESWLKRSVSALTE
jgi:death on curing protein